MPVVQRMKISDIIMMKYTNIKKAKRIHPFGDEGTLNVEDFQKTTLGIPELSIHKDHSEVSMKPNPAI